MAARKTQQLDAKWRERIRTAALINWLQNFALGKVKMSPARVKAAAILLRKVLPDMVATEITHRPLESMADDELLDTLRAIRGALRTESTGDGVDAPGSRESAAKIPSVQ